MNAETKVRRTLLTGIPKSAALASLLAALASIAIAARSPVRDADVWWHLKVGEWILQQGHFPHVGIYSRTAATRPWMAYSWGYEVLVAKAYSWFGVMGIAWFGILLLTAVAGVLFWVLLRISGRFWLSWILCATGCLAFLFNVLPRPVFFSMMFFSVLLMLLLEAHRSGKPKPLYVLPILFALWANFHIQFIYGLLVFVLFAVCNAAHPYLDSFKVFGRQLNAPALPTRTLVGILVVSLIACCFGPYSYHLFEVVFGYASAKFPYEYLQEFQSVDFKHPSDYFLAAITIGAAFVLFRKKTIDLFGTVLLILAIVLTWRGVRDAWVLAISSAALIAASQTQLPTDIPRWMKILNLSVMAALLAVFLFLIAARTNFTERELDRTISREYPVDAVNFLRRNPAPGPLYNDFGWGGFLIWYMPDHPVSIDGRTDLYGDGLDLMSLKSVSGDYESDPYLQEAGIVLLPKEAPLSRLLTRDTRFNLVFENDISVVFVRNRSDQR